jgi:uncharacterized membrane protein YfcA
VATSMATIFFVVGVNTYFFNKQGLVAWRIVFWIALTSGVFSLLSAWAATWLPEKILVGFFIGVLCWIAVQTFLIQVKNGNEHPSKTTKLIPLSIGALSGTVAGSTGVGGGAITTPLMLVSGLVKHVQAPPTSNAIMIFTTLFGSFSFALTPAIKSPPLTLGLIHFDTVILLFIGNILFTRFGIRINQSIPLYWRKTILGLLLFMICIRLIIMLFTR